MAALRAANPRAADRPAWGWPPEGIEWEGKPAATPMKIWPVRPCDPQTPPSPTPLYGLPYEDFIEHRPLREPIPNNYITFCIKLLFRVYNGFYYYFY